MKADSQRKEEVVAELKWERAVHAEQVGVEVKDGVVAWAGQVGDCTEKLNAVSAAQRTHGVKSLTVEMRVNCPEAGRRTDADIAESANCNLGWTRSRPPDAVKVPVENGWLTLSGGVEWEAQRRDAAGSVRGLPGATGDSNAIATKPSLSAKVVEADIGAALKHRAAANAKNPAVEVKGSDVTLTGTVRSWTDRDLAPRPAWGRSSVRDVMDQMNLVY